MHAFTYSILATYVHIRRAQEITSITMKTPAKEPARRNNKVFFIIFRRRVYSFLNISPLKT